MLSASVPLFLFVVGLKILCGSRIVKLRHICIDLRDNYNQYFFLFTVRFIEYLDPVLGALGKPEYTFSETPVHHGTLSHTHAHAYLHLGSFLSHQFTFWAIGRNWRTMERGKICETLDRQQPKIGTERRTLDLCHYICNGNHSFACASAKVECFYIIFLR